MAGQRNGRYVDLEAVRMDLPDSQLGPEARLREVWQRWSETLAWWISLPGVQAWWAARPAPFSPSFTSHVDGRLQSGLPDPGAARRWSNFLSGNAGTSPAARPHDTE
jgi:hypothetical protein